MKRTNAMTMTITMTNIASSGKFMLRLPVLAAARHDLELPALRHVDTVTTVALCPDTMALGVVVDQPALRCHQHRCRRGRGCATCCEEQRYQDQTEGPHCSPSAAGGHVTLTDVSPLPALGASALQCTSMPGPATSCRLSP